MSGTVTSPVHAPVSCYPYLNLVSTPILPMRILGSREAKQLTWCITGRKWQNRNFKPGLLDSRPRPLYLSAPPRHLHSWQACLDCSLQAISKSSSPANPRNNPICKRGGESHLKREAFFLPSWLKGNSLPQAAEGKEGAECSLNVHSPNCFSMTLSSHSRENAGPELKCRLKPFSQSFKRSFVGENFFTVLTLSGLRVAWKSIG